MTINPIQSMKTRTPLAAIAAVIFSLASVPALAEKEFKPHEGCVPTSDCCEWNTTWKLSRTAPVFADSDGKKKTGQLKKNTKVTATEGKFIPHAGKSKKDTWWVKVKLEDGTEGWVDGFKFYPESRCPL